MVLYTLYGTVHCAYGAVYSLWHCTLSVWCCILFMALYTVRMVLYTLYGTVHCAYGAVYSLWHCTLCVWCCILLTALYTVRMVLYTPYGTVHCTYVSSFLQLFKKPHRPKRVHNVAPPIADSAPSPLARLFYRDIAALEPSKDCTLSRFLGNSLWPVSPGEIPYGLHCSLVVHSLLLATILIRPCGCVVFMSQN